MGPEVGMLILILLLLAAGTGIVLWHVLIGGGIVWATLKLFGQLDS